MPPYGTSPFLSATKVANVSSEPGGQCRPPVPDTRGVLMAKKLGLFAVAAAFVAFAPMAAFACSGGSSAMLNDGTQVAQGYGSPAAQPMQSSGGSQTSDQAGSASNDSDSSNDK